jgi:hypothetical protein
MQITPDQLMAEAGRMAFEIRLKDQAIERLAEDITQLRARCAELEQEKTGPDELAADGEQAPAASPVLTLASVAQTAATAAVAGDKITVIGPIMHGLDLTPPLPIVVITGPHGQPLVGFRVRDDGTLDVDGDETNWTDAAARFAQVLREMSGHQPGAGQLPEQ